MIGALLTLALLAAPEATPIASPSPSPSPTPPPSQDAPGVFDPEPDEPDPVVEPMPTPAPMRPDLPDVALVPSLGIGGFTSRDSYDRAILGPHFWVGVNLHPAPSKFGPFMGIGGSFDLVSWRDGADVEDGPVYGMAEMRYGVAFLTHPRKYESAVFPAATIYALAGWRPERGTDGGLVRAGAGLGSPRLFALGMGEACLPLPSAIEFAIDAPDGDFSGKGARSTFRAGWQF